ARGLMAATRRTRGAAALLAAGRAAAAWPAARAAAGSDGAAPTRPDGALEGTVVGRANVQRVVKAWLAVPTEAVRPNQGVTLSLTLDIAEGWHVNSAKPTLEYLIPTSLAFPDPRGAVVDDIYYPEGHLVRLKFADERLSVYEGRTVIRATVRPLGGGGALERPVIARVTYQACSDRTCLPPETQEFRAALRVEGEPVARRPAVAGSGSTPAAERAGGSGAAAADRGPVDGSTEQVAALLRESGLLTLLVVVFGWGLALNLTPCVYPMIPVTIGFFANQAARGWGRRVGLPALYVLGMALTYSVLGLVAGLTGGLFGATLQSPWVMGTLVVLFVMMALSMFGLFEFRVPTFLARLGGGRRGHAGALLMGATVGLVAAPCIGPFVVALLAFVGASGQPLLGFWRFFVLAVGLGLPSLVLGVFSGTVASLPRSGVWLIYAKKVMGVAMLAVAIYFLQPFLSDRQIGWIAVAFAVGAALYLALLERSHVAGRVYLGVRLAIGAAIAVAGVWLALPLVSARPEADWRPYSSEALAQARAEGRPVIIDFFAEWCLPCKELDRYTFSDPGVIEATGRFTLLKADLTSFESDPVREVRERFDVIGVPTIVFIDGRGVERTELRLYGHERPEQFLKRLERIR
ncbi:MAG: protein-disulfide reductase DsbD family protein, partial [Acidobacteriota bacterium]